MDYQSLAQDYYLALSNNEKDWVDRFSGYATDISNNEKKIRENLKKFRVPQPFTCYTCVSKAKQGNHFDLRYRGQSVGEIVVKENNVYLVAKAKKKGKDEYYFGWKENRFIIRMRSSCHVGRESLAQRIPCHGSRRLGV